MFCERQYTPVTQDSVRSKGRVRSTVRFAAVFLAHQLLGTYAIAFLAALVTISTFEMAHLVFPRVSTHYAYWVLTGTPYYPVQIVLAFSLGWTMGRWLPHPLLRWIWVLPVVLLILSIVAMSPLIPQWSSVLARPHTESRLSYYFGRGCLAFNGCIDQLVITMPFYASVAYSLAAKIRTLQRNVAKLGDRQNVSEP